MPYVPVVPIGAVIARKQKQIVAAFQAAGATSAEQATSAAALRLDEGMAFRILTRHEILRDAGEGRLYLDQARWEAHRQRRIRLAIMIPAIIVLVVAVMVLAVYR